MFGIPAGDKHVGSNLSADISLSPSAIVSFFSAGRRFYGLYFEAHSGKLSVVCLQFYTNRLFERKEKYR